MTDLWPKDITKITLKAPLAILQEQAVNISKKTESLSSQSRNVLFLPR